MSLQNGSPTLSYIQATGITVVWNGEVYVVADFYTNKRYIYWNTSFPNQFNASNVMPARSANQFLVLINDNGVATLVPNEDIEVSFDGNSVQNLKERIYGIYEKNEELGEQFSTMYQDIQGIHTSVGKIESDNITIHEEISRIDQKADGISLEVKDITKIYSEDKEASELRENLNGAIIKLNANLGTFKGELQNYFDDNSVSADEKTKITEQLNLINTAKVNVDTYVDKVIEIARNNSQTDLASGLTSAKTALDNANTNLKNVIDGIISDNIITPSDVTLYINAFANYNEKIMTLKNTCDEVILLGAGGEIIEELAKIDMKSNEISLSVKEVTSNYKNDLNQVDQKYAEIILSPDTGITSKVGKIESNINTITENVSKIDQKADSINIEVGKKVNSTSIISAINLSPESIRINASKINIDGYVTFTSLQTSGATIINGDNITSGTITGVTIKTSEPTTNGGVWIKQNGIQIGYTTFDFSDGNFRIQTKSNTAYSSTENIHLMPGMVGSTPSGNGSVIVNGWLETTKLKVNGVEITGGSMTAVFG